MGNELFTTVEGIKISHGQQYWVFTNENKTSANKTFADRKFDYNDNIERFAHEETVLDAIDAFKWLNK